MRHLDSKRLVGRPERDEHPSAGWLQRAAVRRCDPQRESSDQKRELPPVPDGAKRGSKLDLSHVRIRADRNPEQSGRTPHVPACTVPAFSREQGADLHRKRGEGVVVGEREPAIQRREAEGQAENKTGLPDSLKAGVERLSGLDLSRVRVRYNSPKPAQLDAHAYTQGQQIEVAPRQEQHLPHETWHVVQQMQGRVRPTIRVNGHGVNDDRGLEREADVMGERAQQVKREDRDSVVTGFFVQRMPVIQLEKRSVVEKCNLRLIDKPTSAVTIPLGTEVEIVSPRETKRFKLGFGRITGRVTYNEGPNHTKVKYKGREYWIKDSHLGTSNSRATTSVSPEHSTGEAEVRATPLVKGEKASSPWRTNNEDGRSLEADLGKYFEPSVAPVKKENDITGIGGNAAVEKLKKGFEPSIWDVKAKNGQLCNREGNPITGGGAWVLLSGESPHLRGSQCTKSSSKTLSLYSQKDKGPLTDMQEHEAAGAVGPYWAGEMEVEDGKVKSINNQSGTYHFTSDSNINLLTYLLNHEIITKEDIDKKTIKILSWKQTGLDREGKLKTWEGFKGKEKKEYETQKAESDNEETQASISVFELDL